MNDLSDDADTSSPLSEADLNQVAASIESAPPTQAVPTATAPGLSSLFSRVFNPPNTSNDILRALDDMTIPPAVVEKLQPLFAKIGLKLEKDSVTDPYNDAKVRSYTAARGEDVGVVVVLHLPDWVLQTSDAIGFLANAIAKIRDRHGRIISVGLDRATFGYRPFLQSLSDRATNSWMFVPWGDVEDALGGKTTIDKVFSISLSEPPPPSPPLPRPPPRLRLEQTDIDATAGKKLMPRQIAFDDKQTLISMLARWSEAGEPNGPLYFKGLVKQADFSNDIRLKGLAGYAGGPKFNAGQLVDFALNIGTNPKDGNAALGSVLLPLMPEAGLEDATFIASMIVTYNLVGSEQKLDELRARYQIPVRIDVLRTAFDAAAPPVVTGPAVTWAAETKELELQGWFTPDPQWIDIALVMKAAARARSVCRVEVGAADMGTGLLIAPNLVLTNYHVMGQSLDAQAEVLSRNAPATVLRFGAFTAVGPAAAGQEVRLDKNSPIVASSARYDFALLRTDSSIKAVADVGPFAELGVVPVKTNPLYVLQHPEGGPMKLALNTSGVSWVDPGLITVQYTTKVAAGSSGSPCFDADWKLVALHHAGAGPKGEGILMQSIFDQIRQYLN